MYVWVPKQVTKEETLAFGDVGAMPFIG